jgi:hypothetical protein
MALVSVEPDLDAVEANEDRDPAVPRNDPAARLVKTGRPGMHLLAGRQK